MKAFAAILLLICASSFEVVEMTPVSFRPDKPAENLFIVTIDGFRWQEVFGGADPDLLNNVKCMSDTALGNAMYGGATAEERRKKLLPFFWSVLAKQGALYGNRAYNNKVNVANIYNFSYPGYHEMLTGSTDIRVNSNNKKTYRHTNVLEYINSLPAFQNKVVALSSWDVFPFILSKDRAMLPVNSGYTPIANAVSFTEKAFNQVQDEIAGEEKTKTRLDQLTFVAAKDYILKNKPRIMLLGLGETDEYAHDGRYDGYLQHANYIDRMLSELWLMIQSTPGYRNNTTILITTDHGRGKKDGTWSKHSTFVTGSSQAWLAMIGPNIPSAGEVKTAQQFYLKDLPQTIGALVGVDFKKGMKPEVTVQALVKAD
jgi:hypothetical protein